MNDKRQKLNKPVIIHGVFKNEKFEWNMLSLYTKQCVTKLVNVVETGNF